MTQSPPRRRHDARRTRTATVTAMLITVLALVALLSGGLAPAGADESAPVSDDAVTTAPVAPLDEPPAEPTPVDPSSTKLGTQSNDEPLEAGAPAPQLAALDVAPLATGSESDSRATFVPEPNVGNLCANAGLSGTTWTSESGPPPAGTFTATISPYGAGNIQAPFQILNSGTPAGDATMLQLSNIQAGITINGVVVKGGSGYNKYVFGTNAAYVGVNMISPLNNGGKVPAISHTLVCYSQTSSETGSLNVAKALASDAPAGATFEITVTCTEDDVAVDGFPVVLTFDDAGNIVPPPTLPLEEIPAGAECTVEETSDGGASSVTYSPDGGSPDLPPTVTIVAEESVLVTVINSFTGSLDLDKVVSGPVPAGTTFEVTVTCLEGDNTVDGFPVVVTFDDTGDLVPPPSLPLEEIPAGAECTVEETDDGGAASTTYAPDGGLPTDPPTVTIVANDTVTVAVTNTFPGVGGEFTGSVNVEKRIEGGPPLEGTEFVVNIRCIGPTVDVDQDVTLVYSTKLTANVSFQAPSVETVQCTVTERDPLGGAVEASISPNSGEVTLTVTAPSANVVVTNKYGDPTVEVGGTSVTRGGALPFTGSPIDDVAKLGAVLAAVGAGLWLRARRRRTMPLG